MAEFRPVRFLAEAFRIAYANRTEILWLSWPWFVFILLPAGLLRKHLLLLSVEQSAAHGFYTNLGVAVMGINLLIGMLVFSAIAVKLQRFLLTGNAAELNGRLTFHGVFWRYAGNLLVMKIFCYGLALCIGVSVGILVLGEGLVTSAIELTKSFWIFTMLVVVLAGWIEFRIFLRLPAIAVENVSYRFVDSWKGTRSHSLAVLFVVIFLSFLEFLPAILNWLSGFDPEGPYSIHVARTLLAVAWQVLMMVLQITVMALAYQVFHEGRRLE